jgi:8-oxo-dGTP pyrophosphatase MutT (NUDIX family)
MKFSNRPNELITSTDGRKFWISRSPAVTATIVVCIDSDDLDYVLLNQRGSACDDYVGMWSLPCGYLDWDETGGDAAIREVWEECGLNLKDVAGSVAGGDLYDVLYSGIIRNEPWSVITDPTRDDRQNIVLHYGAYFIVEKLPKLSNKNSEPNEVAAVNWIKLTEAIKMDLGFGHQNVIKNFDLEVMSQF